MAVLSIVGAACTSGGSLGAGDLSQQMESLKSIAAEGALLAPDAALGRTTRTYTREHSAQLHEAAAQAEALLRAATTDPGLESARRKLVVFAGRVSAALGRLANASRMEDRVLARELVAGQSFNAGLQ